jgi:hypothetical protein
MKKFEINKTYRISRSVGKDLQFIREIFVEEVNKNEIYGWQKYYYQRADGSYLEGSQGHFTSKIRKATNKDYQIATSLLDEIKATDEVNNEII